MDLLEAMEAMEEKRHGEWVANQRPNQQDHQPLQEADVECEDFLLQQVAFCQTRLQQSLKYQEATRWQVPFNWVFTKLLRVYESHPDGVTEAILLTELRTLLYQDQHLHVPQRIGIKSSSAADGRSTNNAFTAESVLEGDVDHLDPERRFVVVNVQQTSATGALETMQLSIYLHQRFHQCLEYFQSNNGNNCNAVSSMFPFEKNRRVRFTNTRLVDTALFSFRELETRRQSTRITRCLPTSFLALQVEDSNGKEKQLVLDKALSVQHLDQLIGTLNTDIQQLILRAKVLDIGAIRAYQEQPNAPFFQSQIILLGEVFESSSPTNSNSTPLTGVSQACRVHSAMTRSLVLWDDQVALSRLFAVDDEIVIQHPFVHVRQRADDPVFRLLHSGFVGSSSSSSQLGSNKYFLEYGSATLVWVCKKANNQHGASMVTNPAAVGMNSILHTSATPLTLAQVNHEAIGFAVYGQVESVQVSHGVPLMVAFVQAYYALTKDNNESENGHVNVPNFALVVLVTLYEAASNSRLIVEITGSNALKALGLTQGQSVLLEGLVSVNIGQTEFDKFQSSDADSFPSPQQRDTTTRSSPQAAFSSKRYHHPEMSVPGLVALCADWHEIFGNQSAFRRANLTWINKMHALLRSIDLIAPRALHRHAFLSGLAKQMQVPMIRSVVSIAELGWLVPLEQHHGGDMTTTGRFGYDASCTKGYSTVFLHKNCLRPIHKHSSVTSQPDSSSPKWKCVFCCEIWSGMDDTIVTFGDLLMCLEDGFESVFAVCSHATVESLLEISPQTFSQCTLTHKSRFLRESIGKELHVLLSRCESRQVVFPVSKHPSSSLTPQPPRQVEVSIRIDLVERVDASTSCRELLHRIDKEKKKKGNTRIMRETK